MRTVDRFDNLNKALDLVAQAGAQRNLIAAGKALQGVPHRTVDINIVNAVPHQFERDLRAAAVGRYREEEWP
ncbi:MAG: hypothetical protein WBE48_17835, partial [Xanthobacteraceae bacterium]